MENEKVGLKDRLLAGAAYYSGVLAAIISLFYLKDRKGFAYWHCIQALFFNIALFFIFYLLGVALISANRQLYDEVVSLILSGPIKGIGWLNLAIFGVLFIATASGSKFRIPIVCNVTDWYMNYLDSLYKKADEAKEKKV